MVMIGHPGAGQKTTEEQNGANTDTAWDYKGFCPEWNNSGLCVREYGTCEAIVNDCKEVLMASYLDASLWILHLSNEPLHLNSTKTCDS